MDGSWGSGGGRISCRSGPVVALARSRCELFGDLFSVLEGEVFVLENSTSRLDEVYDIVASVPDRIGSVAVVERSSSVDRELALFRSHLLFGFRRLQGASSVLIVFTTPESGHFDLTRESIR